MKQYVTWLRQDWKLALALLLVVLASRWNHVLECNAFQGCAVRRQGAPRSTRDLLGTAERGWAPDRRLRPPARAAQIGRGRWAVSAVVNCSSCRFWSAERLTESMAEELDEEVFAANYEWGRCRLYAPRPATVGESAWAGSYLWPLTRGVDWCAEGLVRED